MMGPNCVTFFSFRISKLPSVFYLLVCNLLVFLQWKRINPSSTSAMSPSPWLTTAAGVPRGPGVTTASCHWSHPSVPCGLSRDGCSSPIPTLCQAGLAPPQNRTGIWSRQKGVLPSVCATWVQLPGVTREQGICTWKRVWVRRGGGRGFCQQWACG